MNFKSKIKSKLKHVYETQYKKLLLISLLFLVLAGGILVTNKLVTGEFVAKGVTLKGGITMTLPVGGDVSIPDTWEALSAALPLADISVRGISDRGVLSNLIIEVADTTEDELIQSLKALDFKLVKGEYSLETMGSSLGESFYRQTIIALLLAFLCMGVVVFITFRQIVPSLFVMLAAGSDIISTLAVVALLGIKLSTAGIAAFLMLIGYSVDTDILLTTRVLKRKKGTVMDRIYGAMKTGLTMSITSFIATLTAFLLTDSDVIKQIMLILCIGLAFDMLYTWIQNAGILRWWLENKDKPQKSHSVNDSSHNHNLNSGGHK